MNRQKQKEESSKLLSWLISFIVLRDQGFSQKVQKSTLRIRDQHRRY
jgi:hypothetical protein